MSHMARPLRIEYPGAWYLVISRRKRGKTSFRAIQCPSPNYSCKTPRSIILANLSHLRSFNSSTIISNNLSKIIRKKFQSNTAFECGDLKKGFGVSTTLRLPARIRCPDCHHEFLLAFSCRGRWFCLLTSPHQTPKIRSASTIDKTSKVVQPCLKTFSSCRRATDRFDFRVETFGLTHGLVDGKVEVGKQVGFGDHKQG